MNVDPELDLVVRYLLACMEAVQEHDRSGKMPKQKNVFIKPLAKKFNYTDYGLAQINFESEQIVREAWHWRDYQEFRKSVFPALSEHRACVETLCQSYQVLTRDIERWLDLLTHRLAPKMLDAIETSVLEEQASILMNDLRLGPVTWNTYLWLRGIILDEERIDLDRSLVIRRPIPADFERELEASQLASGNLYPDEFPSAVVEYRFKKVNSADQFASWNAEHEVEALIQAFRLYKVGSVEIIRYEYTPDSYRCHGGTIGCDKPRINFQYALSNHDTDDLNRFLGSLLDRIPSYMEMLDPPKNPNILGIPLPRYTDCLTREMGLEERVASSVTCLEGLYMKDDETAELSFRLAQRVAVALRHLRLDAKQVFADVKDAYKIRSKFVHGAFVRDKRRKENSELSCRIMNYARISLVLFLQLDLTGAGKKKVFLENLDDSLLDDNDAHRLIETISNGSCVPHMRAMPIPFPQSPQIESN